MQACMPGAILSKPVPLIPVLRRIDMRCFSLRPLPREKGERPIHPTPLKPVLQFGPC